MEFIHRRPPIGDINCPPRVALNDENEHLTSMGLVVLIRGSPTPDLPRLIASMIAAEHGGRPTDYAVYQASITPYVLSCPNTQTRDAVVQRGIYFIPRNQCQFTVNQWRPRFGMGFDPPSYQAWIKITGLPLQAWTVPKVTAIVQKFGHPLHIQPFGAAAGHYRDILVLIATVHPARIPLAYMYREGDYSAQIDILILSWRQWEDNYFPPPNDLQAHGDPLAHPQHHVEHTVSANNSSSSSNSAPSEPTIDYSCWSPRSSKLRGVNSVKWEIKSMRAKEKLANTRSENSNLPMSRYQSLLASSGLSPTYQTTLKQIPSLLATEDPTRLCDSQWDSLISAILKSLPPPVELNPSPSLIAFTPEHSTPRATQSHRPSPPSHTSPLPHPNPPLTLPIPNTFRFENYWLKVAGFTDLVTTTWQSIDKANTPLHLSDKLHKLRTENNKWNRERMGNLNIQGKICNDTLMWITKAEEARNLTALEELLRGMLTERLVKIEDLNEIRWRQRAKTKRIQEGDKNTRFFHSVASQHKRTNTVTSLLSGQNELTAHPQKARLLFDYFCDLIGSQGETPLPFNLQNFYTADKLTQQESDALTESWTDEEIT